MASPNPVDQPEGGALVRGLGLLEATTLIVGSVIGSGIFVAPSIMAGYIQTPGLLMGLWVVGGILTLFGALAYPRSARGPSSSASAATRSRPRRRSASS